jgi:hypothetical protein
MKVCAEISTIAGGFLLIPVASLLHAWQSCRSRPLGIGDFRVWLAAHEMVARRCLADQDRERSPTYTTRELARLAGITERRTRASIKRLEAAGLLDWSELRFPPPLENPGELDAIGGGRGNLAVPRRLLRFLVSGASSAVIATALAVLLRCLSRRLSGWDGRGRFKASWVSDVFGVSIPAVKVARRQLVELGWISPEEASQWSMNRFGRVYLINLDWSAPLPESSARPIPPTVDSAPCSIPLDPDQEPSLPGGLKNQEPARGSTGFSIKDSGHGEKTLPSPRLDDIRLEDLKDTARLLDLHKQAVASELVGSSEADRLKFVAAAEHALAIGKNNPPGLFAYLIRGACYRYVTGADEDAARRRLKLHDFGPPRDRIPSAPPALSSSSPSRTIEPGPSDDARIVKAIREAAIKAGLFRDPWPAFQARYPEWTRGRWDAALVELGLA